MIDGRQTCLGLALLALVGCGRLTTPGSSDSSGPVESVSGGAGHPAAGLVGALPGETWVHLEWRAAALDPLPELALFVSTDEATLFDTPIAIADEASGRQTVTGLTSGATYLVGLGISDGAGGFLAAGPVLVARTGAPVYADPTASAAGADGATPGTAYPSLFSAVLRAFQLGGANVWIRRGTFDDVSLTMLAGVSLYGGFPSSFDAELRDPVAQPTILRGRAGEPVVCLAPGGGAVQVLDGLTIDGAGVAQVGLDLEERPAQLVRLAVGACNRGARLRAEFASDAVPVTCVRSRFSNNTVEGMSLAGAFEILFEDCTFADNGQEGIDADDLLAPDGETVEIVVRDCLFTRNGAEGLDVDLGAPAGGGPNGADFRVRIDDTEFIRNGAAGVLLDGDYELTPGWNASIRLRGCVARGNVETGFALDLDGPAQTYLHRCTASGNGGHGVLITSESQPGLALLGSCALTGNGGYGLRTANGNVSALATHCVVSGNTLGGSSAQIVSTLWTSSVAYLQPNAWPSSQTYFCVQTNETQPPPFLRVPSQYIAVTAQAGDVLTLASAPDFGVGSHVETADDGKRRRADAVSASSVTLDAAPGVTPASLGWFADAGGVLEDYALSASSAALAGGMLGIDAGPFGAAGGGAPGVEELVPADFFALGETAPPTSFAINTGVTVELRFTDPLDPGSIAGAVAVTLSDGTVLATSASVVSGALQVPPPPGGWSTGQRIELRAGLRSLDGAPLAAPLALPIRTL